MSYNSQFWNFFAQDTWKPRPNLTIVYGVRYDLFQPPSANASSPFAYSQHFRTDKNNIAPRLGLAYRFRKTVVRASGGIFYDPFQTDMYRRALLNNGLPQFFSLSVTPTQAFAPSFPNVFTGIPSGFTPTLQDITTVSPDFATLYSTNANVSISREITESLGLDITYLYTRGNRIPIYRNINVVPGPTRLPDQRPIFSGARYFTGFGNIISAESVGQSVYNGLNVTLRKRFSHGYEVFGSWTWSHASTTRPSRTILTPVLSCRPTRPTSDVIAVMLSLTAAMLSTRTWCGRRSYKSGQGVLGYLLKNNKLSIFSTLQSGEPLNMGSNRVLNGDPSTGNRLSTACVHWPKYNPASELVRAQRAVLEGFPDPRAHAGGVHRRIDEPPEPGQRHESQHNCDRQRSGYHHYSGSAESNRRC